MHSFYILVKGMTLTSVVAVVLSVAFYAAEKMGIINDNDDTDEAEPA